MPAYKIVSGTPTHFLLFVVSSVVASKSLSDTALLLGSAQDERENGTKESVLVTLVQPDFVQPARSGQQLVY